MGQSKKVECAVPILRTLAGIRFPERSQRRLRGMNAQAKAGKPLRQYVHDLASVCFDCAPDDAIIGIAYEEASALHPWPYFARTPFIEDRMQEYISSYGRGHTAWWDACLRVGQDTFCHAPSVEPFPNQPHAPSIIDPFTQYFS